jgi:hypothetical protein
MSGGWTRRRGGRLAGQMAQVETALWAWQSAHPTATFDEIEDAPDPQIQTPRAATLADLGLASRAADVQPSRRVHHRGIRRVASNWYGRVSTTDGSWSRTARRWSWSTTTPSAQSSL